ncbi:hypothetical protein D3C84_317780 [compost metagenome]
MVHIADVLHLSGDRRQRHPGTLARLHTGTGRGLPGLHRLHGVFGTVLQALDHLLDFVGRHLGTSRQGPHFIGNHGKTAAHLSCPRRFDGGIERQQVGLLGDAADDRQYLVDRRHFIGQLCDRACRHTDLAGHALDMHDGAPYHFTGLQGFVPRGLRGQRGVAGVLRDVLHGQAHLVHGGGDHIGHFLLAPCPIRRIVHNLSNLADGRAQAFAGGEHFADEVTLALYEAVKAAGQVAQFIGARIVEPLAQVTTATANGHQRRGDPTNRSHQATGQEYYQQQANQGHRATDRTGHPQCLAGLGVDLRFGHFGHQRPVQVAQGQAQRQEPFAVTLEATADQAIVGC